MSEVSSAIEEHRPVKNRAKEKKKENKRGRKKNKKKNIQLQRQASRVSFTLASHKKKEN